MSTEKFILRIFIPCMRTMCLHFYTGQQDPASLLLHPQVKLHRVSSSYVRQLSDRMLISHHNIKLLKCIGQGRCFKFIKCTWHCVVATIVPLVVLFNNCSCLMIKFLLSCAIVLLQGNSLSDHLSFSPSKLFTTDRMQNFLEINTDIWYTYISVATRC